MIKCIFLKLRNLLCVHVSKSAFHIVPHLMGMHTDDGPQVPSTKCIQMMVPRSE